MNPWKVIIYKIFLKLLFSVFLNIFLDRIERHHLRTENSDLMNRLEQVWMTLRDVKNNPEFNNPKVSELVLIF